MNPNLGQRCCKGVREWRSLGEEEYRLSIQSRFKNLGKWFFLYFFRDMRRTKLVEIHVENLTQGFKKFDSDAPILVSAYSPISGLSGL
jgi:hypothetical protein